MSSDPFVSGSLEWNVRVVHGMIRRHGEDVLSEKRMVEIHPHSSSASFQPHCQMWFSQGSPTERHRDLIGRRRGRKKWSDKKGKKGNIFNQKHEMMIWIIEGTDRGTDKRGFGLDQNRK